MPRPRVSRSLIVLNGALLAVLGLVALSPASWAQRSSRARGDYTMVSGRIVGGSAHAVYILDGSNQEVLAARWNETSKSMDVLGFRNMRADAQTDPGR